MTYRAGFMGTESCIRCDGDGDGDGCDAVIVFHQLSPQWFFDHMPKPGWSLKRTEHKDGRVTRVDLCPNCKTRKR